MDEGYTGVKRKVLAEYQWDDLRRQIAAALGDRDIQIVLTEDANNADDD